MPIARNRKIVVFVFSILLLVMLILVGGRYFIFYQIRKNLHSRLQALREKGIDIRFESARLNPWTGTIEILHLQFEINQDSVRQDVQGQIPHVLIKGVKLLPFITDRTLMIRSVFLRQPTVTYSLAFELLEDKNRRAFLENIQIDHVGITQAIAHIKDTLARDTVAHIQADLEIDHLGLERERDSLMWRDATIGISNLTIKIPESLYSFSAASIRLGLTDQTFRVDSLTITPLKGKHAFMKASGRETDHIKGLIPYIAAEGIQFYNYPERAFEIRKVNLQLQLQVFRDKRYPFFKSKETSLPAHFLQRLPFHLQVDTITVENSFVSYEEFPEDGDSSGRIHFEKLRAQITHVHNRKAYGKETIMHANANFMGTGKLKATFTFPYDTTKPYRAWGSLQNFPLTGLNSMLGSAAQARVESGTMTNLAFNFYYNMYRADGTVELNYENLRVVSLRSNRNNEQTVSVFKTFILNTFIIRKNMNDNVDSEKRTGTILFHRDRHRSILNYWAKALLSGISSAYKLDKLKATSKNTTQKKNSRKNKALQAKL